MMQEKTEQNWTQADSAPGASQDQAALGGDKGTDAAKEAAGPRGYGAHGGTHPRGREDGRAQNKGPEEEPLYSQAELQRELDRVAKKERERGRRQAQREQQAGTQPEGGADGTDQQTERENAQRATAPDGETGREGGTAAAEQSTEADPADLLDAEQQRMLGRAMADKAIQEGDEAVQRGIERLLLKEEPLTAREDETLFWLFNHASLKACAEELTKRGVDGESIVKDKDFIAFAEMMRSDVPLLKVYSNTPAPGGTRQSRPPPGSGTGAGARGRAVF